VPSTTDAIRPSGKCQSQWRGTAVTFDQAGQQAGIDNRAANAGCAEIEKKGHDWLST
jgi:hypothetical protein